MHVTYAQYYDIHVLMRDEEEEERKKEFKQGQTNKQSKATQHMYMVPLGNVCTTTQPDAI